MFASKLLEILFWFCLQPQEGARSTAGPAEETCSARVSVS